jgi:glycosyltransferase involved in cell wall biosynthesis
MWNLPWSLAWQVEQQMPGCTVYYVAGDWPYAPSAHEAYWGAPTRRPYLHWLKRLVGAVPLAIARRERRLRPLQFEHVLCVSEAVRQDLARHTEIPLERSEVVYNGIDVHQFAPPMKWDPSAWRGDAPACACCCSVCTA